MATLLLFTRKPTRATRMTDANVLEAAKAKLAALRTRALVYMSFGEIPNVREQAAGIVMGIDGSSEYTALLEAEIAELRARLGEPF